MRSHQLVVALAATAAAATTPDPFDWDTITPSRDLIYHDCYGEYKCARLEVPLDWKNESDPRTAAIAITKLPAVVPDDDPTFGGSIFGNPGGPGGSGVDFVVRNAKNIQHVLVDKPGHRHYEIVSFDPRGIGRTTPRSDCFHANVLARNAYTFEVRGNGQLDSGLGAINYGLAMTDSFSRRCKETEEHWGEAMRFANTPSVARDMVEMVDKIDELRKREAAGKKGGKSRLELRKQQKDENVPRLQYIGYSYGTVLGNYFATLFPGRVGRMVLDGVSDANDYSNGAGWLTNLVDTDKIFDEFWEGCFKAGPSICPLARDGGSPAEAQKRFWTWVEKLDNSPQPAASPSATGSIMVIRGGDVLMLIGSALYNPLSNFQQLAHVMSESMAGNFTNLAAAIADGILPAIEDSCPIGNQSAPDPMNSEAASAVLCGDGDDVTGHDASWWNGYVYHQKLKSKIFGAYWSTIRFTCSSWPFKTNWYFKGPFETPKPSSKILPGRPAAPLLFLTSRLDPVTPLSAARAMSRGHPDSAIVIQDSLGHCTFGRGPSPCTWKIVADYFDTGKVPEKKETFCETTCGPWDEDCDAFKASGLTGEGDIRALHGLDEPLRVRRFPLGLY